jgi:hypothetical protein
MDSRALLSLALLLRCSPGTNDVVVNEFVASNATGLTDESGAFPDWIEMLNRTDEPPGPR